MEKLPLNSEIITTGDGSPTLKFMDGEPMHSMAGALGESLYIYGEALKWTFDNINYTPCLMSVGLGLGYNELIAVAYSLTHNHEIEIDSFEVVPELVENFLMWANNKNANGVIPQIANLVAKKFSLTEIDLKNYTQKLLDKNKFSILGDVSHSIPNKKYHCVFYDSFSQKSSPQLWTEDFLNSVLKNHADKTCAFTSYACLGRLTRLLKFYSFTVDNRSGFAGKRDCTYATRK